MSLGPLILDLEGTVLTQEEAELLRHPAVGGVIFFARNIVDYEQLEALLASVRQVRRELLLCVDQEGGRVQRCRQGFTKIPPMQVFHGLFEQNAGRALTLARDTGWLLAAEILCVGFDFSFAPVLDVDESFSSVIGDRSFSSEPDRVCQLSEAFIAGAHEAGMAVTGKHFPGHGSVREDSHKELPRDLRPLADVRARDMKPFIQLAPVLDAVMPAHIVFPEIDGQAVGFSAIWLRQILREEMGFGGVVFSDDLSMEGAAHVGGYAERARHALRAGCDMVLACNRREGAVAILQELAPDFYEMGSGCRASMRARRSWTRAELQQMSRWLQTEQELRRLTRV